MTESVTLIPAKWFHRILTTASWPDLKQDLLSSSVHELLPILSFMEPWDLYYQTQTGQLCQKSPSMEL